MILNFLSLLLILAAQTREDQLFWPIPPQISRHTYTSHQRTQIPAQRCSTNKVSDTDLGAVSAIHSSQRHGTTLKRLDHCIGSWFRDWIADVDRCILDLAASEATRRSVHLSSFIPQSTEMLSQLSIATLRGEDYLLELQLQSVAARQPSSSHDT